MVPVLLFMCSIDSTRESLSFARLPPFSLALVSAMAMGPEACAPNPHQGLCVQPLLEFLFVGWCALGYNLTHGKPAWVALGLRFHG